MFATLFTQTKNSHSLSSNPDRREKHCDKLKTFSGGHQYRVMNSHFQKVLLVLAMLAVVSSVNGITPDSSSTPPTYCYVPIDGGWRIRLPENATGAEIDPASRIGVTIDDARQHRRPLYPPADRSLIWNVEQLTLFERCAFRPVVVAYNAPRFIFDGHSAGGFLGHLYLGLKGENDGKW